MSSQLSMSLAKSACTSHKQYLCNGYATCVSGIMKLMLTNNSQVRHASHHNRCPDRFHVLPVRLFCSGRVAVKSLVDRWIRMLTVACVPEPRESVHLIVAHALGKKMLHEVDVTNIPSVEVCDSINMMCQQRLNRWPVQYIIGEWDFHDMTLKMEPPVLIPRPETEELAALIVQDHQNSYKHTMVDRQTQTDKHTTRYLDIGCGCGALSLYILKSIPEAYCISVDQSQSACNLTQHNAEVHGLTSRLQIVHGDIFHDNTIREVMQAGPYDVIMSNPPYIPSEDMDHLQAEIYRFEDHKALEGGTDGINVIRQILKMSTSLLSSEGQLWLEVNLSHPAIIQHLLENNLSCGLQYSDTFKDYTNRDRFCRLKRTT